MMLAKYSSYKDSGVEWLEEIPENWQVKRIKDYCVVNEYSLSGNIDPLFEINYVDIGSVDKDYGIVQVEKILFSDAPSRARRIVKEGNVILSTVRTYLKAIALIEKEHDGFVVSTGFATIHPNKKMNSKFLYRAVFSNYFIERIIANSVGVSYPAINSSFIRDNLLLLPGKESQIKISKFLDKKIAHIDSKIKILKEKIISYDELKKSIINESVCRGLNNTVLLKDSKIPWIGKIPCHWMIKRVKDCFSIVKEKSLDKNPTILSLTQKGIVIRDTSSNEGQLASTYEGYTKISKGDIVLNSMDLVSGFVDASKYEGVISPAYSTIRNKENSYFGFYNYYFQKHYYERILFHFAKGVSIFNRWTLNNQTLLSFIILLPPKEEQIEIANYLDEKTSKIDNIISKIKDQIETLKEFRKTLINDVVTGKVRVQDE